MIKNNLREIIDMGGWGKYEKKLINNGQSIIWSFGINMNFKSQINHTFPFRVNFPSKGILSRICHIKLYFDIESTGNPNDLWSGGCLMDDQGNLIYISSFAKGYDK